MVFFYIEALEAGTIRLRKNGSPTVGTCKYGKNTQLVGSMTTYTYGNTISLSKGQRCYFYITSSTTAFSSSNYLYFYASNKIKVGGNIKTLIGGTLTYLPRDYCFYGLFYNCTTLIDASDLELSDYCRAYCYSHMFQGCTNLKTAPKLLAKTLYEGCYSYMFYNCRSLTSAPALPATTLATSCYEYMFYSCYNLSTAPALPALTLAESCYKYMFSDCRLSYCPSLPATTLAISCYEGMFYSCSYIKNTTTPIICATSFPNYCCKYMFYGCDNIGLSTTSSDYATEYRLPYVGTGTSTGTDSFLNMFSSSSGEIVTPTINTTYYINTTYKDCFYIEAIVSTVISISKKGSPTVGNCYYGVGPYTAPETSYTYGNTISLSAGQVCRFKIVSSSTNFSPGNNLYITATVDNSIKVGGCLGSLICTDVGSSGSGGIISNTIPRNYCFSYLFSGCSTKLVDASKLIFVQNINDKTYTYNGMFSNCTALTKVPYIIPESCGSWTCCLMFYNCTSLTSTPTLYGIRYYAANYSHMEMFWNCTSLTTVCSSLLLVGNVINDNAYVSMFQDCTSLKLPPVLGASSVKSNGYTDMFSGCSSLLIPPKLPATSLGTYCYYRMFKNCTSLAYCPELPATTLQNYCYMEMFNGCTSLLYPADLAAGTLLTSCYQKMFANCTGIKLANSYSSTYDIQYRVPKSGTGYVYTNALTDMFYNTGGTWTGTPDVNIIYYLHEYTATVTYDSGQIASVSVTRSLNPIIKYNNNIISCLIGTKTLKCEEKVMYSDVDIAEKRLICGYKQMHTDVVVTIS